jgi:hypothetical protein
MSSKQKEYLQKSNIFRPKHLQIEELTECRIITKNLVYVIGLSSSIANKDKLMRIPMSFNARSLNLSNSVAIVTYEACRQQNYFNLSTFEAIKGEDFLESEIEND